MITTERMTFFPPFVLLVDVLAMTMAALAATLLPILAVLLLTLLIIGRWLVRIPDDLTGLPAWLQRLGKELFLHDVSTLDQLYRIAAFIVVAIIAMLASFLYQRFLGEPDERATPD